jgi:methionyl-tRNA formyltransferase
MTEKSHRIVFMGTPEFAVASLRALYENSYNIAAVVTTPDRPAGRGQKITSPQVKVFAQEHRLPLMQPDRLRDPAFIEALRDLHADIFVVVAFRMLPEEVWRIPPLGTFNLHASLLPQYRGAAPINHAIINGETRTGVTTFLIDSEIDTGKILLKAETEIFPEDNAGTLHDRLMLQGAELVIETIKGLIKGTLKPVQQQVIPGMLLYRAPKIYPADAVIKWEEPAVKIHNMIRGLSPYPGAVTSIRSGERSMRIKILESRLFAGVNEIPGTLVSDSRSKLIISCGLGALEILTVQPEGRKRMTAAEFLHGNDLSGWETD